MLLFSRGLRYTDAGSLFLSQGGETVLYARRMDAARRPITKRSPEGAGLIKNVMTA